VRGSDHHSARGTPGLGTRSAEEYEGKLGMRGGASASPAQALPVECW
jgi:hypothetical protein